MCHICSLKAAAYQSLLAINLMKMEIYIFQAVTWPHVDHLMKGSCLEASNTMSDPCVLWCWCIFCMWRYVFYLLRDITRPLLWDIMQFMGESSSPYATTLKRLVSIDILVVKRTMFEHKSGTFWEEVPRNFFKKNSPYDYLL